MLNKILKRNIEDKEDEQINPVLLFHTESKLKWKNVFLS